MEHAVTIKDILIWIGIPIVLIVVGAGLLGLLALFNPFVSGH